MAEKLVKDVSKIFEFVDYDSLTGSDLDTPTAFILEAGISVAHYKTMRSEYQILFTVCVFPIHSRHHMQSFFCVITLLPRSETVPDRR